LTLLTRQVEKNLLSIGVGMRQADGAVPRPTHHHRCHRLKIWEIFPEPGNMAGQKSPQIAKPYSHLINN